MSGATSLISRRVYVDGHRTSVRLETVFWETLRGIASQQNVSVYHLVSVINRNRIATSLTSAIRTYVVTYLLAQNPG
jgi:predicted DNA-binding ribbon-helix-helix protein